VSRLVRLYPRAWRVRYGDELEALLDERRPSPRDRFDLALGALDARLHPELVQGVGDEALSPFAAIPPSDLRMARRLGLAALVGAAAWTASWIIAANGPLVSDVSGSYRDGSAAMPVLFAAGALLIAGLLGQLLVLPGGATNARIAALVAMACAFLFSLAPWVLPVGAIALVGLEIVALSGWRSGVWPAWSALLMSLAVLVGPLLIGSAIVEGRPDALGGRTLVAGLVVLIGPWLAVGLTLVRAPLVAPSRG